MRILLLLSLISTVAFAGGNSQPPQHCATKPTSPLPTAQSTVQPINIGIGVTSGAMSNAESKSNSDALSNRNANATGGTGGQAKQSSQNTNANKAQGGASNAQGGQGGSSTVDSSPTATSNQSASTGASSANGQQAISQTYEEVRQTPPVILPTILVSDCGAGMNAGGSKSTGAAAFGFTWTTEKCYELKSGQNWVAIGEYEAACHLWADLNRKAFARQHYAPNCKAIAMRLNAEALARTKAITQQVTSSSQTSDYVTKQELDEVVTRMMKKTVSK